jgi:hypothetical protein
VIEIGPLLRLANGSHQLNASIYVLAGWVVAVKRALGAGGAPLGWVANLLNIEAKVVLQR